MSVAARERAVNTYITIVAALAAVAAALCTGVRFDGEWAWWGAAALLLAAVLANGLSIPLPGAGSVSIATVPHLVAALLLPPWLATLLSALGMLLDQVRERNAPRRSLFNVACIALTVALASMLANQLGLSGGGLGRGDWTQVPAFFLVAAVYFAANSLVVTGVMALARGEPYLRILATNMRMSAPAEFAVTVIGGLLAFVWVANPYWVPLAFFPALISQIALTYIAATARKTSELQQQTTQLQHLNLLLASEIAQREATEQENARLTLEAARARALEELSQLKSEFIGIASHELRTPLTTILGFSELLLNPSLPPEQARRFSHVIHQDALMLSHLVDNLLDVSRIENRKVTYEPAVLDLSGFVDEHVGLLGTTLGDHRVMVSVADEARWVYADPAKVRQILTNLVSNAVKYSPRGKDVQVTVEPAEEGYVRVAVEDHGIGIPPEHMGRIFERFQRVDVKETRGIRGTGLGLYIVKHLVELHGGTISVRSTPGQGSTFAFTLPASAPEAAPAGGTDDTSTTPIATAP